MKIYQLNYTFYILIKTNVLITVYLLKKFILSRKNFIYIFKNCLHFNLHYNLSSSLTNLQQVQTLY